MSHRDRKNIMQDHQLIFRYPQPAQKGGSPRKQEERMRKEHYARIIQALPDIHSSPKRRSSDIHTRKLAAKSARIITQQTPS
nr:hypothetical protein Iba_chr15aCG6160 [Ipomoea batatas]